jgi:alkanesulfonate monooxygenase SsuD/methylene tetrahydromethanopterin reductase-like flavin-dependent oxidoreductase (luciferase family)
MRFDVMLTAAHKPGMSQADVYAYTDQMAGWAQDYGYCGVWLLEHHFTGYGTCPSAITYGSYLLGRYPRLRVGSAITVVPLDHPVGLAEKVSLLDHLSGGRFDFGVGRGTYVRDFDAFGADMTQNHKAMIETMDRVRECWTEDAITITSQTGVVSRVEVRPRPVADVPNVYVATGSPDTVDWARGNGYPLLLREGLGDDQKVSLIERYGEAGDETAGHALSCVAALAPTVEQARDRARDHLSWWIAEGANTNGLAERRSELPNYERYFKAVDSGKRANPNDPSPVVNRMLELNPIGTVESCRERLLEVCSKTGIRHFIFGFEANPDGEETREVMATFMTDVLQPVREELGW